MKLAALLAAAFVSTAAAENKPVFLDTSKPLETRVDDLVGRLTPEQKAALLNHKGTTVTVDGFAIRSDQWNQCLNGVQWDRPTTLFPSCIALSATWDPEFIKNDVAKVLSDEARAIYNGWHRDPKAPGEHKGLIYRDPVINIGRNPYWGRNHEAWGEDPYLTGRMAVAYVQGIQGEDPRYLKLAATLKHYAVNNVETDRFKLDAKVPERTLREYWLPHFRDAVVEGGACSLMASYNAINGVPNNINRWLLTDVLKGEWKHGGFVVSDLGGVKTMVEGHERGAMTYVDAVAQSLMAGCDFSDKEFEQNIPAALREGKLSQERLDDALRRVLRVRFRLGEFDPFASVPYSAIPLAVIDSAPHRATALEAARRSIVLLQNKGGLLPLDAKTLKKVAVLGPLADQIVMNGYNGVAPASVTPLEGIRRALPGAEVTFAPGAVVGGKPQKHPDTPDDRAVDAKAALAQAVEAAKQADVALVFVGTDARVEQEGRDRTTLGLAGTQQELVDAVIKANPRTAVIEMSAGPLTVPAIKENAPAILQAWWPGEEGGTAIAEVLFGKCNPAGRLSHTVYASEAQVPSRDEYDISKGFTYMYAKGEPLFAFGHGLSYTTFAYSDLRVSPETIGPDGTATVTVDVENTGKRAGDEVVQLYLGPASRTAPSPAKELRGFKRVNLEPGEKKKVEFALPADKLGSWDTDKHAFVTRPGTYDLMVGASSSDIRLRGQVRVDRQIAGAGGE